MGRSRMAIPVDGSAAGPSSFDLTALVVAIRARQFALLADILDTLELEVIFLASRFGSLGFCGFSGLRGSLFVVRFSFSGSEEFIVLQIAASGASKPQDWPYAVHVLAHVVNLDL